MATDMHIMPDGPTEPLVFNHSPVSRAFSLVLEKIGVFMAAERELSHGAWFDLAAGDWRKDVELARAEVLAAADAVLSSPVRRVEDRVLRKTMIILRGMILARTPGRFFWLKSFHLKKPQCFECRGNGAVAYRVRQMLATAHFRMQEMEELLLTEEAEDTAF